MPLRRDVYLLHSFLFVAAAASAQAPASPAAQPGEQVYRSVCVACHESGVANAPKFGDRSAWASLIAEGQHVLTGHAWVGVRAMPARGGSATLTLAEFSRAVAHMARASGANWKDPDSAMLRAIAKEADERLAKSIKEMQAMQRELRNLVNPNAKTATR